MVGKGTFRRKVFFGVKLKVKSHQNRSLIAQRVLEALKLFFVYSFCLTGHKFRVSVVLAQVFDPFLARAKPPRCENTCCPAGTLAQSLTSRCRAVERMVFKQSSFTWQGLSYLLASIVES